VESSRRGARSRARIDELTRFAPARTATPVASQPAAPDGGFLMTEVANIGAGAELLATRPSDREAAANVLRRVRAMRGIAGVKDHPSLADVLEATEFAAHPLERGEAQISAERLAVLGAAATVLRGISAAMRLGSSLDPASPELARFAASLDAMQEKETEGERVVPISELYYEDGGPTVVQPAANPPTSPAERFRLEVVSQGEHSAPTRRRRTRRARRPRARQRAPRTPPGASWFAPGRRELRRARRRGVRGVAQRRRRAARQPRTGHAGRDRRDARAAGHLPRLARRTPPRAAGAAGFGLTAKRAVYAGRTCAIRISASRTRATRTRAARTRATRASHDPHAAVDRRASLGDAAGARPAAGRRDRTDGVQRHQRAAGGAGIAARCGNREARRTEHHAARRTRGAARAARRPERRSCCIAVAAAIERCLEIRDQVRSAGGPVDAETLGELFDLLDLALTD
jgi:hypothetical protein